MGGIPIDAISGALGNDDYTGMVGRDAPGSRPAQPGVVQENKVVLVVRHENASLLGGSEEVQVISGIAEPQIVRCHRIVSRRP